MKTKYLILLTAVCPLLAFNALFSDAHSQGSLTPPGAPGATMLTLSQIEPRMPISSAGFNITKPGAYYLTANLVVKSGDGIDIETNGVILDLNGFTIFAATSGAPESAIGLLLNTLSDITIFNGHIVGNVTNNAGVFGGNGFDYGIVYYGVSSSSPANFRVIGVSVSGCLYSGIAAGANNSSVVESCTVQNVGSTGISAGTVSDCVALQCGGAAISAYVVSSSKGSALGSADGIDAGDNAQNCFGASSGSGDGIYAPGAATGCYGLSSSGTGLAATTAENCYGDSSSGTGLEVTTALNCYGYGGTNGDGLDAYESATGCYGQSISGVGLDANTAENSSGYSGSGTGLYVYESATGCYGQSGSGTGLAAANALNCYGSSDGSGTGLDASVLALGCFGYSSSGTGLVAFLCNVGVGYTSTGTATNITHSVNSFAY